MIILMPFTVPLDPVDQTQTATGRRPRMELQRFRQVSGTYRKRSFPVPTSDGDCQPKTVIRILYCIAVVTAERPTLATRSRSPLGNAYAMTTVQTPGEP